MEKSLLIFIAIAATGLIYTASAQSEFGKLLASFPSNTQHGVAGTIYVIDEVTIWVRGFTYDGSAPDAFFYGGDTDQPSSNGVIIPDQDGSTTAVLGMYSNENLILTLPVGKTINSFKWISIWCRRVRVNFGHVNVPAGFEAPAPWSLGELGFAQPVHRTHADDVVVLNSRQFKFVNLIYDGFGPAAYFWADQGNTPTRNGEWIRHPDDGGNKLRAYNGETVIVTLPEGKTVSDYGNIGLWCDAVDQNFGHVRIPDNLNVPPYIPAAPSFENCEVLIEDRYQIAWTVNEAENTIMMQFIGVVDIEEYMAFGISGSNTETLMVGSDVIVVFIDSSTTQPEQVDYYLNDYSQCLPNSGDGACPDVLQGGVDNVEGLKGMIKDGITYITVERPLVSSDKTTDADIPLDRSVFISWSIGRINPTGHTSRHEIRTPGSLEINFGRASSSCPAINSPIGDNAPVKPWDIEPLKPEPGDVIEARIGPAGGEQGYMAIAGQVGWGISWYLDGRLVPEVHVQRNQTYTFKIYGGNNDSILATYHPFYITNDMNGGYAQKTSIERKDDIIYAGPTVGTLCEYKSDDIPEDYDNFKDYSNTLTMECTSDPATGGILEWFVELDTPDVVYYQCYQHRYFGWKILVSSGPIVVYQYPLMLLLASLAIFNLY